MAILATAGHPGGRRQAYSSHRAGPMGRWILLVVIAGVWVQPAAAQSERHTPSLRYHAAFSAFYEGEYRDALDVFQDEARGAIKTPQSRWIDSICYETMVGECYYEMGNLGQALEHYTAALQLYASHSDWMVRLQFPPIVRPSSRRVAIPWGSSSRKSRPGQYPSEVLMGQGRINNNEQYQQGGVVQQAFLYPIQAQEIIRCTTLAMRRRAALLGPTCPHDPLTASVLAALQRRPGLPNHWSECWIDVELGLALSAAGKVSQALPYLQRSMVASGEFDHPMTSIALVELGRIALGQAQYPVALKYFEEATYAAAYYPDLGVLEEAFRGAALAFQLGQGKAVYPRLIEAARWAKVKGYRHLEASLLISLAENHAALGQTDQAAASLEAAARVIGRREMGQGVMGNRLNFLRAKVHFQQKRIPEGDAALAASMKFMQRGSFWLFHIGLVDRLYTRGAITPRIAMNLYDLVLRDPQPMDWTYSPMETLAPLVTPHPLVLEHWFEVALSRREHEKALEITDRARRHRFFSTLPFGGRLGALRWVLEGPPEVLRDPAKANRRDLLARYPLYAKLSQQATDLRQQMRLQPPVADTQAKAIEQGKQFKQIAALSRQQEAILREIAVSREPAEMAFPPLRPINEVQQSLADGQALLAFFATSRHLYAFLLNRNDYAYWQVGSPKTVGQKVVGMFRAMGHYQQNHSLSVQEVSSSDWKQSAKEVLDVLLEGSRADFTQSFEELIVVPDGLLWYVPFEALQVEIGGRMRPLIARFKIRYAPTVSLATPIGWRTRPSGSTGVVVGRLYPQDKPEVAQEAFAEIARVLPGSVAIEGPLPAPSSLYASSLDRLIVLDDVDTSRSGPYGWAPLPLDANKAGSSLGDWLPLPFGGPETVVLPGFHTAAENSLKEATGPAVGQEVFLSVCGLLSSGSQTLLLSRWRSGGRTSFDFVREFVQELPHTTPADAYQRAVFLTAAARLDIASEPRIKKAAADQPPTARHPFFWSAYMLVDSGRATEPADPTEPAGPPAGGTDVEPVVEVRPPGQHPPGQHPPGQHPPGQHPPGQHPPGQHPPGQQPPGQQPPGQSPPGLRP